METIKQLGLRRWIYDGDELLVVVKPENLSF